LAVRFARVAGDHTLRYFGAESLGVDRKSDGSPVTRADREAEELLRERIRAARPDDGILGEEGGESPGTSGVTWILDPVDGTRSFVHEVPLYGTLVGIEIDGAARVGVAYLPALREMVYAARGLGAVRVVAVGQANESRAPARVSGVDELGRALFCTTSVGGFERSGHRAVYDRLRGAVARDRGWSDCYGHVLVATGRAEVMVDPLMHVWDCAALQPIVEEAGGVFTDLAGRPTHRGGSAISSNAALAPAIRRLVAASDA